MDPKKLFIVVVAIAGIATGTWMSYTIVAPPPEPRSATVLHVPGDVPDFSLMDQFSRPFTRASFSGQWDLVFFGFTHCPDVCPLTLQVLASAKRQLADAGHASIPRIVLVSVDPERDIPDVIGQYVAYFDNEAIGVTGELDELRKLTDGLGIFFQKAASEDGNYSVDHSAAVLVIDMQGRLAALFSAPHEAGTYVHDLPILLGDG